MAYRAEIPYGCYWSTPFARWQGAFANLHSIEFAAHVAKRELARRNLAPEAFDHGVLGFSVPQKHAFYGLPWLAGMAGVAQIGGPTVMQACATGVRVLLTGVQEIECDLAEVALTVTCDRTSNGPHLYYPNPRGPGGTGMHEDWVLDNFGCDPFGGHSMIATAENVAKKHGIGTAEQHELVLRREAQYRDALADGQCVPPAIHDPAVRRARPVVPQDGGDAWRRRRDPFFRRGSAGEVEARARRWDRDLRRTDTSG